MAIGADDDLSAEAVRERLQRYQNWGQWGPGDQLGSMNYVTPDKVASAAALVRRGATFSLALPIDDTGPMNGTWGRGNCIHIMMQDGGDVAASAQGALGEFGYTDDAVYLVLQSSTQWDSLAHIFHGDKMYNGFGTDQVTSRGAAKNSITNINARAVGRGVLLDVARHKNVDWLDKRDAITADELQACADAEGVEVGEGDFVLVRTGAITERRRAGSWGNFAGDPCAGLGVTATDFFCSKRVAAVATDTPGFEVQHEVRPAIFNPVHLIMLVNAGIILGELWDLDTLAEDCARDGVYEFLLVAPPLPVTGAVGSPVNPQAIK